jgi:hypothetical protein
VKYAIVTFLAVASTAMTAAIAQDGLGHGPPDMTVVTIPTLLPAPTTAAPTVSVPKVSQLAR